MKIVILLAALLIVPNLAQVIEPDSPQTTTTQTDVAASTSGSIDIITSAPLTSQPAANGAQWHVGSERVRSYHFHGYHYTPICFPLKGIPTSDDFSAIMKLNFAGHHRKQHTDRMSVAWIANTEQVPVTSASHHGHHGGMKSDGMKHDGKKHSKHGSKHGSKQKKHHHHHHYHHHEMDQLKEKFHALKFNPVSVKSNHEANSLELDLYAEQKELSGFPSEDIFKVGSIQAIIRSRHPIRRVSVGIESAGWKEITNGKCEEVAALAQSMSRFSHYRHHQMNLIGICVGGFVLIMLCILILAKRAKRRRARLAAEAEAAAVNTDNDDDDDFELIQPEQHKVDPYSQGYVYASLPQSAPPVMQAYPVIPAQVYNPNLNQVPMQQVIPMSMPQQQQPVYVQQQQQHQQQPPMYTQHQQQPPMYTQHQQQPPMYTQAALYPGLQGPPQNL